MGGFYPYYRTDTVDGLVMSKRERSSAFVSSIDFIVQCTSFQPSCTFHFITILSHNFIELCTMTLKKQIVPPCTLFRALFSFHRSPR